MLPAAQQETRHLQEESSMVNTLDYYNRYADSFAESTLHADMHLVQNRFLALLEKGSSILDFGCGSGRDTRYFLERGYDVSASDGSAECVRIASAYTGIQVREMLFQELNESGAYDGIWACSSILHLPKTELLAVFEKMCEALKPDGVVYTSFKYGRFEGERGGRYFTDFTEDTFLEFIKEIPGLCTEEWWITGDARPGRGEEKWLNMILRKRNIR